MKILRMLLAILLCAPACISRADAVEDAYTNPAPSAVQGIRAVPVEPQAPGFEFSVQGGLTGVAMDDFNTALEGFLKGKAAGFVDYLLYTGSDGSASWKAEEAKAGKSFSGQIGYATSPNFTLGAEIEYITLPTITGKVTGAGIFSESIDFSMDADTSLLALMVGAAVKGGERKGANYRGFLYGGPIWATMEITERQHFVDPFFAFDETYHATFKEEGSGIAVKFGGEVGYGITDAVSIFVAGGYRFAKIAKMKSDRGVDWDQDGIDETDKGETYKDKDENTVEFDFSGYILNLGVRFLF
jgi:hypothetical protein